MSHTDPEHPRRECSCPAAEAEAAAARHPTRSRGALLLETAQTVGQPNSWLSLANLRLSVGDLEGTVQADGLPENVFRQEGGISRLVQINSIVHASGIAIVPNAIAICIGLTGIGGERTVVIGIQNAVSICICIVICT